MINYCEQAISNPQLFRPSMARTRPPEASVNNVKGASGGGRVQ